MGFALGFFVSKIVTANVDDFLQSFFYLFNSLYVSSSTHWTDLLRLWNSVFDLGKYCFLLSLFWWQWTLWFRFQIVNLAQILNHVKLFICQNFFFGWFNLFFWYLWCQRCRFRDSNLNFINEVSLLIWSGNLSITFIFWNLFFFFETLFLFLIFLV